ncbi:MAG: DNA polymerase II large subunit, partial [Candidatus Bathyarchaeota archaeon]
IPFHPKYCYFWKNITHDELIDLRNCLLRSTIKFEENRIKEIFIKTDSKTKLILEKLLIPHEILDDQIILREEASVVAKCVGIDKRDFKPTASLNIFQLVSELAGFEIKDKYSFFIGARMGRPEKAEERKMRPPVHVLFPIGLSGGSQRNIIAAGKKTIEVEIVRRKCEKCKEAVIEKICPKCGSETFLEKSCPNCLRHLGNHKCPSCGVEGRFYSRQVIDVKEKLKTACKNLKLNPPDLLKGVRGLTNTHKIPEPLEKGLLRARNDLTVFKDGTIRYDATNAVLTHFKPLEIEVSPDKLNQLGYRTDMQGNPLQSSDQTCELKVQDVIIPEKCGKYLLRVAAFIDDLLTRLYNLQPFYNASSIQDLLGHMIIGLSPHTSAGVVGRIVGFSKLNVCYSHPMWVSAKRRDCDGDEDALMLALDVFLNFSREYLPSQIGGIMDACLLLTPVINPLEIDDQVWTLDLSQNYPLEFFQKTLEESDSKYVKDLVDTIGLRLGKPSQYEGYAFTHDTSNINYGTRENMYKRLGSMMEKLQNQMFLVTKIDGVNEKDVARKVLSVHFMRDIVGNLKVFASQSFRCKKCNFKHRRIPLSGRCTKCGGQLSLTVFKGSVEKYLETAEWIAKTYELEDYYSQRVALISDEIASIFTGEKKELEIKDKDIELTEFM